STRAASPGISQGAAESRKEIAHCRALQRDEGQGTHRLDRGDADADCHQPVDDAFAEPGREARGEAVADELLDETVADRDRTGNGKMTDHIAHEPHESQ